MRKKHKPSCIGLLTAGGDCPGLNAAIRGVAKAAISEFGMKIVGVLDGFRGLVENRFVPLDDQAVSGILTHGGTILGTSRDKPHKMKMGDQVMDMTATAVGNARRTGIDCLVCLGGGGTQKNALALQKAGLDVLTLPKTIDNDVAGTDVSFGFDTAMYIATEAIDRLHTTATSHNRLIVCEVMGHHAGWLALGAGIAGGADIILTPEIPYDLAAVAEHLHERRRHGKRFSIIVAAEGAISKKEATALRKKGKRNGKKDANDKVTSVGPRYLGDDGGSVPFADESGTDDVGVRLVQEPIASRLARQLQELTGTEARVTSLGHVQRGGIPTPRDRILCTRLGARAAQLLAEGVSSSMVAVQGDACEPVPLTRVAGFRKLVPPDHPWIEAARLVGTCLGI
jgi:ATP-dependent phosphofructokinase / diphosphate-dependent phosphofructokinase